MDEIQSAVAQWLAGAEAYQAILILSSLAVGTWKKGVWGVRLVFLGSFLLCRAAAWAFSAKPVHAGVKAALDAVRDEKAVLSHGYVHHDGDSRKLDRLELGRIRVAWQGDLAFVYMDGDDHTDLFDRSERRLIARACQAEKAKRDKAKEKAKAEERLLARQILAESLGAGCECGHGPACKCGPCDCPSKG